MSQTVSEMFGYERESDDDKIVDNYDDSSSDVSMPSDVTVLGPATAIVTVRVRMILIITTTTDSIGLYLY